MVIFIYTYNFNGVKTVDLEQFRNYCALKKGVSEGFPFDDETLVIKVGSKMFALTNIKSEVFSVNLKCDPLMAEDLRREYDCIRPGYHMNKLHWNTVTADGTMTDEKLCWLIDLSYDLVFKGLKKSEKALIEQY